MKNYKNPKKTVTIGIPAFNEEENILNLLKSILSQRKDNFKLSEIIVASDGSTDQTEKQVLKIKNRKVKLIKGIKRLGQQYRQIQIKQSFNSDLLIFIEADSLPQNKNSLAEAVSPFYKFRNLGLVVGYVKSLKPNTFIEKSMYHGNTLKSELFDDWKQGINVYTLGGHCIKVLSQEFARNINWPSDAPEDSYTYFRAKELGIKSIRIKRALFVKRNVTNGSDRLKQFTKFISGRRSLVKYFTEDELNKDYYVNFSLILKHTLLQLIKNPFWISFYILNTCVNRILTLNKKKFTHLYEIYTSTKNLKV